MKFIKKLNKYFLIILFFPVLIFSMEYDAKVIPYFLPGYQRTIFNNLMKFLDSAQHNVYIAMYLLTDQRVVEKLIELKQQKSIDVQVILDDFAIEKGMAGAQEVLELLLNNYIPTIVDLSESFKAGIMHNKYVVVDGARVWTGSANFTHTVLSDQGERLNEENIVIINSPEVARLYELSFKDLKNKILRSHIGFISSSDKSNWPDWLKGASSQLYANNPEFKEMVKSVFEGTTGLNRIRLIRFFPDLGRAQKRKTPWAALARPITTYQRSELEQQGYDTTGMSYDEAYALIGQLRAGGQYEQPTYEEPRGIAAEPATPSQINLLKRLGVQSDQYKNLSKKQASELIDEIKFHRQ